MTDNHQTPAPASPGQSPAPGKKRKPTGKLEAQLGLLVGIGGLIASRLGQLWVAFDVFSQFTLHFAIVTVAFLMAVIARRAKMLVAFLIMVLGVAAIGAWPHLQTRYALTLASAATGEREIRVASFNAWYSNQNVAAIKAEIERIDADVMTLAEVGPDKKPLLDSLKPKFPHQANCFAIDYCNLAVISKFPMAGHEGQASWEGPPNLRVKFGPELGGVTVMAVHTIRFPHSRAQFRQVVALSDLIETIPGRKIVMGDFNATPFSRIVETLTRRTGLVRLSKLPSWPAALGMPQLAIDHIFVSPSIRPVESQMIGEPVGSDHFPVSIRVALPLAPTP